MSGLSINATHYQKLQQQPIEIMQALMTPEQFIGFLWGNVIKYTLRCGSKDDPEKEIEKVLQYSTWYLNVVNEEPLEGVDEPRLPQ